MIVLFNLDGLNNIWSTLDSDCGPDACCLQPTIQGKGSSTDESMGSLYKKKNYFLFYFSSLSWFTTHDKLLFTIKTS